MERLRNMSLKKSFFILSFCCMLVSILLLLLVMAACEGFNGLYLKNEVEYEQIDENLIFRPKASKPQEQPSQMQIKILKVVNAAGFLTCILLPIVGLGVAGILFYRIKLKIPIAVLRNGTERILKKDLDFSVESVSEDELGQLCRAFETMRAELLKTNQELWEQAEERKRLNAAFSHDLRNPVAILKGTVKLLRQGKQDEQAIDRLESYTLRIESYIEAMSGIQRLEQIPVKPEEYAYSTLRDDLEDTMRVLAPSLRCAVLAPEGGSVRLDRGIFLNVMENLVSNGARFAQSRMKTALREEEGFLFLTVWDDGEGFPKELVQNGPKPFGKMKEEASHFGMGLYSCKVLCLKHGGRLELRNPESGGAEVTAVFQKA